ncbi:EI24 domain-containing protein [Microbacterium luteolum]|uniref:EI24 domain-containing protein n=1 Tax=Microbacterium luteolum TaxID=69367 RepID=A0ABY7XQX6_MICLT|nr:EI24 domain-containing protein [Microbacterium luteolum]WDM42278.1 EI24 domain-containing protein [Microbacterium luteolum]
MIREFAAGIRTLLRGFGLWRTRPGLMNLGLIPAIITIVVLGAVLLPLALNMTSIAAWITPFAEEWPAPWKGLVRGAVGFVVVVASLALASAVFTALTLTIGDPFYQRIWHAVEVELGDAPPEDGGGFWSTVAEGLRLVVLGILIAILVLLIGLIPAVGGFLGPVAGVVLTGRLLARELTGRAFDARDLSPADRAALFSGSRARVLGFGVATQLCFLIPGGAVVVMPVAVAGSTMLARDMLARTPLPSGSDPSTSSGTQNSSSGTQASSSGAQATGSGTHSLPPRTGAV